MIRKLRKKTKLFHSKLINSKYFDYLDEFIYRLPNPLSKINNYVKIKPEDKKLIKILNKEGIVKIENFLDNQSLNQLKFLFENEINYIESLDILNYEKKQTPLTHYNCSDYYEVRSYNKKDNSSHNLNPLNISKNFFEIIINERIISIISEYLGKKISLQQAAIGRIYPREPENYSSYQWHRDTLGKRINVMILISDVKEDQQRMSYLKKSHKKYLTKEECKNYSRISDKDADRMKLERFECSGLAGTVFIFDANGIHRGNRNLTIPRDVIIFSYGAGRYQWEFEVNKKIKEQLNITKYQAKFVENNLKIKWV